MVLILVGSTIAENSSPLFPHTDLIEEQELGERRVVVLYAHDIEHFQDMNHDEQWVDAIQSDSVRFKVKKYFLKQDHDTSQETIKKRAKRMWQEALKFKPQIIVAYNNEVWSVLKDELKAAAKAGTLVGLFDIYLHTGMAVELVENGYPNVFVAYYRIQMQSFFDYLAKNGVSLNRYYIVRDRSTESYWAEIELRDEIHKQNPRAKITTKTVNTVQDLRMVVFQTQIKPRGFLLPLTHSLFNVETKQYDSISVVMGEIVKSNRKHIEVSLMSNRMVEGSAFSSFHTHSTCRQNTRRYMNVLKSFLQNYNGDHHVLMELTPRLTMNGKRVNDLGAENMTKDLSLIHCLEDGY